MVRQHTRCKLLKKKKGEDMFKNMKIGARLGLGFGVTLVLMVIIIATGIFRLSGVNQLTEQIVTKDWTKAVIANDIIDHANDNAKASMELFLTKDKALINRTLERMEQNKKTITGKMQELEALLYLPEGKAILAKISETRKPYVESFSRVSKLLLEQGKPEDAARMMINETVPAFTTFSGAINDLIKLQGNILEKSGAEAAQNYESGRNIMIIAGIIILIISVGFAYMVTLSITRPLSQAVDVATQIANGELTAKIGETGKDETGQLLAAIKNMIEKLLVVVVDVKSAAENVAAGSQELSSSSEQMSQGATEQAASIEEVSSSMEQMVSNIRQNADNAQQTDKIATKSSGDAKDSGKAVTETVSAMREIAGKISIIEEIARQTNLLALNAAIEAARAGEHGKGFAVVASEVRKLAERSQTAAREISQLSSSSVEVAEQAGEMLSKLVPDIQKTAELVQEISGASNEQNAGVDQINKAIQQLDQVIQQNAGASEEMASTAEELSSQAEQLQGSISFFKIDNTGSHVQRMQSAIQSAHKPVHKTSAAPMKKKSPSPVKVAASGKTAGIAIDMGNGGFDKLDDEFEKF